MKDFAKSFYLSTSWKQCQRAYLKKARGLCEECLKEGIINAGEIVHHKIPLTPNNINDINITLNFDNLELVCREHHAKLHKNKPCMRYTIDELGRVII